jgi:hypothetical protein
MKMLKSLFAGNVSRPDKEITRAVGGQAEAHPSLERVESLNPSVGTCKSSFEEEPQELSECGLASDSDMTEATKENYSGLLGLPDSSIDELHSQLIRVPDEFPGGTESTDDAQKDSCSGDITRLPCIAVPLAQVRRYGSGDDAQEGGDLDDELSMDEWDNLHDTAQKAVEEMLATASTKRADLLDEPTWRRSRQRTRLLDVDFSQYLGANDYGPVGYSDDELDGGGAGDAVRDEKYDEALRIVIEQQKASTSLLQRRLRIGYGRAASIIDMMYREGLVGPEDGSKPRAVLVKRDFLERLEQIEENL